jgi:hypothetical protein
MHTATTAVSTAFHCGRHCTISRGRRHPVPVLPQQYRQSKQQLRSVLLFVIQPKVSQLVSSQYSKFKPRLSATVYRNFRRWRCIEMRYNREFLCNDLHGQSVRVALHRGCDCTSLKMRESSRVGSEKSQ